MGLSLESLSLSLAPALAQAQAEHYRGALRKIPYGRQSINISDVWALSSGLRSPWLTLGPAVEEFECKICGKTEASFAVAVSSGSAALDCAYAAIGLEPGDEVITTPMTFASTATTALNLGGKVMFADIQHKTGNIDPRSVEALISERTKAIVVVDYAGRPADMEEIMAIGAKRGIPVIEDGAYSLGSLYKGRPVGSIAYITTFSFFPTKNITTGEGGAVVTNNREFERKARLFRSHGVVKDKQLLQKTSEGSWFQEVQSLGLNYRIPDLLARLGISQLRPIDSFKKKRQEVFRHYEQFLGSNSGVVLPVWKPDADPMWHLFLIRVNAAHRRRIFDGLTDAGYLVQVNYFPVNSHPYFRSLGFVEDATPEAKRFYESEISLPIFSGLKKNSVRSISARLIQLASE